MPCEVSGFGLGVLLVVVRQYKYEQSGVFLSLSSLCLPVSVSVCLSLSREYLVAVGQTLSFFFSHWWKRRTCYFFFIPAGDNGHVQYK